MSILNRFQQKSKYFYLFLGILSIVNSLIFGGMLMFINNTVTGQKLPYFAEYDWLVFIGLLVVSLVISRVFRRYMINLTTQVLYDFELFILERFRYASYESYLRIGPERVHTSIQDVRTLAIVPEMAVDAINAGIILFCGILYLFWISPIAAIAILTVLVMLVLFYVYRNNVIERDLNEVRDLQNTYYTYLQDLINGFKELKMSVLRNENMFHKFIKRNRQKGKVLGAKAGKKYTDNELVGSYSFYVLLGFIIFGLPKVMDIELSYIASFVVTILYLMGPINVIVGLVPRFTHLKIAYERVAQLEEEVANNAEKENTFGDMTEINETFHGLRFENLKYSYGGQRNFTVGPINLEFLPGEVVFITGGNGSGKSTFVNLLTGLFRPHSGDIYLNGQRITEERYHYYSNQMSSIFTDSYLFKANYDSFDLQDMHERMGGFIDLMKLKEVITIDREKDIIDSKLSKGQQKRLLMIYAMMENRHIFVLDEWAAEQDPQFRKFFYEELIPELRAKGKTVIAVTHDDQYFDCADRIIKFDFGKIVEDKVLQLQ